MAVTQPIRSKHQVRRLAEYYLHKGHLRNYILVMFGVHTALRISDILRLRWDDVYDFQNKRIRQNINITEKKTHKQKCVALNKHVVNALALCAAQKAVSSDCFLFENPRTKNAISRIQAYRIIRTAAEVLDIGRVSCHSLRKTFGYHAWKDGISPVIIMEIYNHSSFHVTRRYLGVLQDDKDEAYLKLSFTV